MYRVICLFVAAVLVFLALSLGFIGGVYVTDGGDVRVAILFVFVFGVTAVGVGLIGSEMLHLRAGNFKPEYAARYLKKNDQP